MIYKKAAKKLRDAGIKYLVVQKGLWGPYLYDPRMLKQTSPCHETPLQCVEAAIKGERPEASK